MGNKMISLLEAMRHHQIMYDVTMAKIENFIQAEYEQLNSLMKTKYTVNKIIEKFIEQENMYYTPNEEDFRIGYECEVRKNGIWEKKTINRTNELSLLLHQFGEVYMDGKSVRTPYLAKEQIEAEGFTILKKSDNNYIYATKGEYIEMRYDMSHVTLAIYNTIDASNEIVKLPAFYGECKSINEFRQIIKLLGI